MILKNNFHHIDNYLTDNVMKKLSGSEWKLLTAINRLLVGWHQLQDFISFKKLADFTELSTNTIANALKNLANYKIIIINMIYEAGIYKQEIKLNLNTSEYILPNTIKIKERVSNFFKKNTPEKTIETFKTEKIIVQPSQKMEPLTISKIDIEPSQKMEPLTISKNEIHINKDINKDIKYNTNTKENVYDANENLELKNIKNQLLEFGIKDYVIEKIIKENSISKIDKVIIKTLEAENNAEIKTNKASYFMNKLKFWVEEILQEKNIILGPIKSENKNSFQSILDFCKKENKLILNNSQDEILESTLLNIMGWANVNQELMQKIKNNLSKDILEAAIKHLETSLKTKSRNLEKIENFFSFYSNPDLIESYKIEVAEKRRASIEAMKKEIALKQNIPTNNFSNQETKIINVVSSYSSAYESLKNAKNELISKASNIAEKISNSLDDFFSSDKEPIPA